MKIKTSLSFKRNTIKTIISIIVFIITYIFFLFATIGLVIGSVYLAFFFVSLSANALTVSLGLALIACALTVLFYLVKFFFSTSKLDLSHLTPISAAEEPLLFLLIEDIALEVGTSFPKKVFLSYDVNAFVFYNSNFWSMFLPVHKNLQIGIGLINSVSKQELKAILAHEFGHFSQKSMRVGSFVYNVNQVIYNMLYKNESLDSMNEKWASINGFAAIFVNISAYIIKGIQKILQDLYTYININYMALSREMEFHADEIAANVAGSVALEESLLRLPYAHAMLNNVINYYEEKFKDNIKSANIYQDQLALILFYANKNKYRLRDNLPIITLENINKYKKSKLNIEDQWASHPTEEDRIASLQKISINKEEVDNSRAISILNDNASIAQKISDDIFSKIQYTKTPVIQSTEQFLLDYQTNYDKNSFSSLYNQYFDLTDLSVDKNELKNSAPSQFSLEELFDTNKVEKLSELNALKEDKLSLESIEKKELKLKTFSYNNLKYKSKQAREIIEIINNSIQDLEIEIKAHKNEIFRYFYTLAKESKQEDRLLTLYYDFSGYESQIDENIVFYNSLLEKTTFIMQQTPFDIIAKNLLLLKSDEKKLKNKLKDLLKSEILIGDLDSSTIDKLNTYINNELPYFNIETQRYNDENLELLFGAIQYLYLLNNIKHFNHKKELLDFQASLVSIPN